MIFVEERPRIELAKEKQEGRREREGDAEAFRLLVRSGQLR
jgi:hypothetical protein